MLSALKWQPPEMWDPNSLPTLGVVGRRVRIEVQGVTSPIAAKRSLTHTSGQVSREQISQAFDISPSRP